MSRTKPDQIEAAALNETCDYCLARPGHWCVTWLTRKYTGNLHLQRFRRSAKSRAAK